MYLNTLRRVKQSQKIVSDSYPTYAKDAEARVGGDVEGWHAPQQRSSLTAMKERSRSDTTDMLIRMTTTRAKAKDSRSADPKIQSNVRLRCTDVVMAGGIS